MMKMCLCIGQKLLWTTRGAHNPNLRVVIMHLSAAIGGGGGGGAPRGPPPRPLGHPGHLHNDYKSPLPKTNIA